MEDDIRIAGIVGMAMGFPIAWANVDFDISFDAAAANAEFGPEEVGAGFEVPTAGLNDGETLAGLGVEFGTEFGIVPDALQVALRETRRFIEQRVVGLANEDRV